MLKHAGEGGPMDDPLQQFRNFCHLGCRLSDVCLYEKILDKEDKC